MATKWKDVTHYGRLSESRESRSWELDLNSVSICVTRHVDFPPQTWVMSTRGQLGISKRALAAEDVEVAKMEAVAYVRQLAAEIVAAIDKGVVQR